jgi:type I restriction enzyme S subunit
VTPDGFFANFDLFAGAAGAMPCLRKLILQLAVRGKVVPQSPADAPASILVSEIERTRRQLIQEQRIVDRSAPAPPHPDEEPYQLPNGWQWMRLSSFGTFCGGGTPSKSNPSLWEGSIPWVSPKDMKAARISDVRDHISSAALEESSVQLIPAGSLLMVVRGMILARAFPVALSERELTINQDMKALKLFVAGMADYLLLALSAAESRILGLVTRSSHGTCRIDSQDLARVLIPLPPLPEQRRILAKVDRLLGLCDELESGLKQAQAVSERLATAAIHNLIAASEKRTPDRRVAVEDKN